MQLTTLASVAVTPKPMPAKPMPAKPMPAKPSPAAPAAPTFTGGIQFTGTGRFTAFAATASDVVYGDAAGYTSVQDAMDAITMLTIGARATAAGIFEHDGRFYGRRMDNAVTFATGATWKGAWRLEQYPADLELLNGTATGTTTRDAALRAIVDGAQRIGVTHLPAAGAKPAKPSNPKH